MLSQCPPYVLVGFGSGCHSRTVTRETGDVNTGHMEYCFIKPAAYGLPPVCYMWFLEADPKDVHRSCLSRLNIEKRLINLRPLYICKF